MTLESPGCRLVLGILCLGLALGGCSAPTPKAGCPSDWDAAVVWSTETGAGSELQFFSRGAAVGTQQIPYLAISPSSEIARDGDTVLLVANGPGGIGDATAVRFHTATCTIDATPVAEHVVLAATMDGSAFFTASWLNGSAQVFRHEFGSDANLGASFPGMIISALALDGGRLYALGSDQADFSSVVTVLDASTLETLSTVSVSRAKGGPASAAVVAGKLVFPVTSTGRDDNAGHWLGVMDPSDGKVGLVDLGEASPYGVVADGTDVFVAHTFMNPAHGPMSQYRGISRYDTSTGTVTAYTVAQGVRHIAVDDRVLAALATDDSLDYLLALDRPSLSDGTQVALVAPDGTDYSAGVLVP